MLHYDEAGKGWFGGMFWDGRATGKVLGDPLAEQAQGPYLNPLEQAIATAQVLCVKVRKADYAALFEEVWGAGSLDCAKDVTGVYEKIGRSVAAYERSTEVNPFTSKFDQFWDAAKAAGKDVTKIKCGTGGMGCDAMAAMFPAPEVDQNRATLGMFPRPQVDNIVLFLKTLTDGYLAK